jgi:hypothetical protein
MEMKTFLLGCGAQKAGTTWLANSLGSSPEYWNGGIKEWRFWKHYFDRNYRLSQLHIMKKELQEHPNPDRRLKNTKFKWRFSALKSPESVLQNISDDFIAKANVKVLGDMTPSNGTLDTNEFAYIKDYFHKRGIAVKPLLIMRDPFERIWSAVRMVIGNRYPAEFQNNQQFICQLLLEKYRLKNVERRTRYEYIIRNLENVFDKKDICYEFSEQLFSQDGLDRVTNHLGISKLVVDLDSPNPSPKLAVVPDQIKLEIISYYKDTYLTILKKFGDDAKYLWRESFKLL